MNLKKLTLISLLAAMTALLTMILHVTIPATQGYVHFGDSVIYLAVFLIGGPAGAFVGAVGGAIADLIVAPIYALPTCIIKALMALLAGYVYVKSGKGVKGIILSYICGGLVMVGGYYLTEVIILGSFASPVAAIPFNIAQVIASVPLSCILFPVLRKMLPSDMLK
ncbi:MAG: ECF transporter S component [Clostridia bacterium]|nr:ECF transporter S component [Clostridia bacterium]